MAMAGIEDAKIQEADNKAARAMYGEDPTSKINNNMVGFSLSFDPLKEVLNSIISTQKMTKNRLDEVIVENIHVKKILTEYEEKFVFIEAKLGKFMGMSLT